MNRYIPPVILDGPHYSRRAETVKLWLVVAVVFELALATRCLDDRDDDACSPGPRRAVDARGLD